MKINSEITDIDVNLWDYHQTKDNIDVFNGAEYRLDFVINKLVRLLTNKRARVLDIGLGSGYLLKKLEKIGFETYGLDISRVNIKRLKKILTNTHLELGNINKMPFKNEYFDAIVASEILEHLDDKDLTKALKEISRCLRKNGVFVVTVPADENLRDLEIFCPYCKKTFHRYGHKQSFSKTRLNLLFKNNFNDFKIIKFLEIDKNAGLYLRFKHKIKMKLVNLPLPYFESFIGRYMVYGFKTNK